MICFNCEKEIVNPYINCPHCGYRYQAADNRICPNRTGAVCKLTENMCTRGIDYMTCPIKEEAEKEADF